MVVVVVSELVIPLSVPLRSDSLLLDPVSLLLLTPFLAHTPTSSFLITLLLLFGGFALLIALISDALLDLFLLTTLVFALLVLLFQLSLDPLLLNSPFIFSMLLMLEIFALVVLTTSLRIIKFVSFSCPPEILHFLSFIFFI